MMREIWEYTFVYNGGVTTLDWITIITLLAIAAVYVVAPTIGYPSAGRGLIMASMWLLVATLSVSLFKYAFIVFVRLAEPKGFLSNEGDKVVLLFSLLELGLFVVALALFLCGLGSLRRSQPDPVPARRDYQDD